MRGTPPALLLFAVCSGVYPVARPEPAQRTAGALPVHWPELRLLAWVVSAAKTPLGVAAPPITTTAKSCPLQHPPGFFKFQPNSRLTI